VCFVTGEAGSGKTALVTEFARRAQDTHAGLLVAVGQGDAQTGVGDPYLPFREILKQLAGDVEAKLAQGSITQENAGRLRDFLRVSGQALVDLGPDLIDIFVPGAGLATRAGTFLAGKVGWLNKLEKLSAREAAGPGEVEQSHIFEQYTDVLKAMAAQRPLVLVLDDLQWADVASINLLFRLGRRIGEGHILIVGAYRPDDVALGRGGERHPLEPVLNELKRYHGDVWVDLGHVEEAQGRQFVDAFLDTEPNRLGEGFRQAFFQHTEGHPLFTIELLRNLQERGDLVQDEEGRWIEGPVLDWGLLPTRVEGVIEERIGRLEEELREALRVASVEGEEFTAEVVARVQAVNERGLVRQLSGELDKQHRLVGARGIRRLGRRRLSLYRFQHNLFQKYLYNSLDEVERAYFHEDVGLVLEELYGEQTEEIAVQLARHFLEADRDDKALAYLMKAGDAAARVYANAEAVAHYTRALEVAKRGVAGAARAYEIMTVHEARAQIFGFLSQYAEALADLEAALALALQAGRTADECRIMAHIAWFHWLSGKGSEAVEVAREAEGKARALEDHSLVLRAYMVRGLVAQAEGRLSEAYPLMRQCLFGSRANDEHVLEGESLFYLGIQNNFMGRFGRAAACAQKAYEIKRRLGDRVGEFVSLYLKARAEGGRGNYDAALVALEAGRAVSEETNNPFGLAQYPNTRAWLSAELGDWQAAYEFDRAGLEPARAAPVRPPEISTLINLVLDCTALGKLDVAEGYVLELQKWMGRPEFGFHAWRWQTRLADAHARLLLVRGRHAEAAKAVRELLGWASRTQAQKYLARGLLLRA
ncbi:MAG: AAA family ATPase, partial [Anaerolineae bacterium]